MFYDEGISGAFFPRLQVGRLYQTKHFTSYDTGAFDHRTILPKTSKNSEPVTFSHSKSLKIERFHV